MDDVQEAAAVQAALEALPDDATAEQVLQAVKDYRSSAVNIALMRITDAGGGGGAITVTDGSTEVENVTTLELSGATVSEESEGVAAAAVSVPIRQAQVTLTDAQIKALPTVGDGHTIVEGQPNKIIDLVSVILLADFTAPYTNILDTGAGEIRVVWKTQNVAATAVLRRDGTYEDFLGDGGYVRLLPPDLYISDTSNVVYLPITPYSQVVGDDIALKISNIGALTGGDPANTLKVTALYMLLDV